MIDRLRRLDRRVIFIIMALSIVIPLLWPIRLPVIPSQPVLAQYHFLENLPAGSTVLLGFDYGPSTAIELDPAAVCILQQCFRKGIRVVGITLLAEGVPYLDRNLAQEASRFNKTYGVDYVDLGFQVGGFAVIKSLGHGFSTAFPHDRHGQDTTTLPLLQAIHGYSDIAIVVSLSSADPGIKDWVKVVSSEYNRPVGGACTAVYFSELSPYLNSGQLVGLIGGLRGAAEYEQLAGTPGTATRDMDAQSIAHITVATFIVLANIVYFSGRRQGAR